jgi:hypothetical protein
MSIRLAFRPTIGQIVTIPQWGDFLVVGLSDDGPNGAPYDVAELDDCAGFTLLVNCHTACLYRYAERQAARRALSAGLVELGQAVALEAELRWMLGKRAPELHNASGRRAWLQNRVHPAFAPQTPAESILGGAS